MYTPSELRDKLKGGHGLDRRETEQLLNSLFADYEVIYAENEDLKKKNQELNESLSYYKSIEKTLQKALILAEKTSQDIKATALKEADAIEMEARNKADKLESEARRRLELLEHKTLNLIHQYDFFKIQFENLLNAQLKLINSESFMINTNDFLFRENELAESSIEVGQPDESSEAELKTGTKAGLKEEFTANQNANSKAEQKSELNAKLGQLESPKDGEQNVHTEDGFEFINLLDQI